MWLLYLILFTYYIMFIGLHMLYILISLEWNLLDQTYFFGFGLVYLEFEMFPVHECLYCYTEFESFSAMVSYEFTLWILWSCNHVPNFLYVLIIDTHFFFVIVFNIVTSPTFYLSSISNIISFLFFLWY
jgi:hypothetical protein